MPVTLLILVIAFGSLVAALVPLLLGITTVVGASGLVAIPSQITPIDSNLSSVILLIGLAVGVDYSLFYLRREREERADGARRRAPRWRSPAATSGRAVLVSGVTVIVAMAGMFISGDKTFFSFAEGTILVVAIAVFASLTVLPAMLALARRPRRAGPDPVAAQPRTARASRASGRRWSSRVMRRPWLSIVLAGGAAGGARDPRAQHEDRRHRASTTCRRTSR